MVFVLTNVAKIAKTIRHSTFCVSHTEADNTAHCGPCRSLRREKMKSSKICTICERRKSLPNITKCDKCRTRTNKNDSKYAKEKRIKDPAYFKNKDVREYKRLRQQVLGVYGTSCACCGESIEEFLTIDHIDGNGNKHRREIGQAKLYAWLKRNGFPKNFQTLCASCQLGKEKGFCPEKHKAL